MVPMAGRMEGRRPENKVGEAGPRPRQSAALATRLGAGLKLGGRRWRGGGAGLCAGMCANCRGLIGTQAQQPITYTNSGNL
jgi:hypothetical protein